MGFLDGFLEKKFDKPIAGKDVIRRATAGGQQTTWTGQSVTSNWDIDKSLERAYSRVVWVFRAVHTIAAAQASLDLQKKDTTTPQGHVVDDPEFYRLVNRKPNPIENAWEFRYRLSSQCLLSPLGAFIEIVRGKNSGKIKELYLLDPGTVEIVKSDTKWVEAYKVKRADGNIDRLDPDNVVWIKTTPHPTDVYRNVTPLESAGVSVETDYFARLFNRNFLKKDGRPGLLIGVNGDILPEDAEELKNLFSGGFGMAGETRIIEAENMNVVDLAGKPRDAQWAEAIDNAKDNILAAFGVPESVLGNASGRCLRATELVYLADGSVKPAQELVGMEFELMQPFENGQRAIKAKAEYAKRESVYKITTFSGRTLEVNGEHPLFMALSREKKTSSSYRATKRDIFPYGWTELNEIKRSFDQNDREKRGTYTEVAVPLYFEQQHADNELITDLDADRAAGEKFEEVPEYIFAASLEAQKAFIGGVYSAHGRMSQHTSFDLYVPTREYAKKLQALLLRVGVSSYIGSKKMTHTVSVSGFVNMRHFLDQITLTGKNADNAEKVRERIEVKTSDIRQEGLLRTDGLPPGLVWDRILDIEDLGEDDTVAISIDDASRRHYLSMFWEHNTYNNADAEGEAFWTGTMKTHCDSIARALEILTGDDDDQVYLEFDYSAVDVLQAAQRRRMDRYRQDLASGAINMNDYRVALGQDPIDKPYFRVYFHPNGVIGGDPADVMVVMQQMQAMNQPANPFTNPFTVQTPTGGDGVVGGFNDQVQGELAASGGDHVQTVRDQAARTLRSSNVNGVPTEFANPNQNSEIARRVNTLVNKKVLNAAPETKQVLGGDIHRDLRHKTIGFIEGSLESWSNRQLSVVGDRLNHAKVRKGTRHWDGGSQTKDLDVNYIVDSKEWTSEAVETIVKVLETTMQREIKVRSNDLLDSGHKPKTGSEFVSQADLEGIKTDLANQLQKSVLQQSNLVQRHIGVQDRAGFSIEEMQKTLQHPENFDRYNWITLLAKRVTTFAIESMYDKLYSNVDAKVRKTWITHPDEAFRDSHGALNDQEVEVSEVFGTKSGALRFPTDTLTSEGDNCSCWLVYEVS